MAAWYGSPEELKLRGRALMGWWWDHDVVPTPLANEYADWWHSQFKLLEAWPTVIEMGGVWEVMQEYYKRSYKYWVEVDKRDGPPPPDITRGVRNRGKALEADDPEDIEEEEREKREGGRFPVLPVVAAVGGVWLLFKLFDD